MDDPWWQERLESATLYQQLRAGAESAEPLLVSPAESLHLWTGPCVQFHLFLTPTEVLHPHAFRFDPGFPPAVALLNAFRELVSILRFWPCPGVGGTLNRDGPGMLVNSRSGAMLRPGWAVPRIGWACPGDWAAAAFEFENDGA